MNQTVIFAAGLAAIEVAKEGFGSYPRFKIGDRLILPLLQTFELLPFY